MLVARIIVLGAGVCGLSAGILLSRDGHEVTVLERDAEPVPESIEDAFERWSRGGVSQFRQAHVLLPRGRAMLEQAMPDVLAGLKDAGGQQFDFLALMPPSITDRTPRVVREPVLGADHGTPHVTGLRTETGDQLQADLVVDAMGRRSQLPRWLEQAGATPMHEEAEDSGFIYYTRYFRDAGAGTPAFRAPTLTAVGSFSVLTIQADNGVWSVTLYISAGDRPLKRLRDPGVWEALVGACPLHAQWLEGEPVSDVLAMGGVVDRYRRLIVDGQPIATGIVPVGDAWACSNPSLGRGMTLGFLHVQILRDVVREHVEEPHQLAQALDARTEAELTPWYRETVTEDRARASEIEALREGRAPEVDGSESAALRRAMLAAVARDPDVFRAFLASRCCLTTVSETLSDRSFAERVVELARGSERFPVPGPDRAQVLALIDNAAAA
jgi:flavin-dependent dehydrogenase